MALAGLLAIAGLGCSLGNISRDDCTSSSECADAFGLGSVCQDGYCSDAPSCKTGQECRETYGGGACVNSICTPMLPADPTCFVVEPPDLLSHRAVGDGSYNVLGGIFSLHESLDTAISDAARLAVRDINDQGGGINGRKFGIVFCDNEGLPAAASDEARTPLNEHAMDYLAGTLGVPVVIGPLRSSDSFDLIARVLDEKYPTAIISPGATSPALTGTTKRLATTDVNPLFWRTCPSDVLQGEVLYKNVIGPCATTPLPATCVAKVTNVAVIYVSDAYGNGLSSVFAKSYGANTTLIPFDSGGDFTMVASLAAASPADGVLLISVLGQDTVGILKALSTTPLATLPFFFTDGSKDKSTLLDPKLPMAVKLMILNGKGTAPAQPSGPNYNSFKANLLKDFNLNADSFAFTAQAYDAAYCASYAQVYAQAKTATYDGRTLAEGLAHLSKGVTINVGPNDWPTAKQSLAAAPGTINITGVSGDLDFDPIAGEAPAPIEVWSVLPDFSDFKTDTVETP